MERTVLLDEEAAGRPPNSPPRRASQNPPQAAALRKMSALDDRAFRLKRMHSAEAYMLLFEKSHAMSTTRRGIFRFFCGLVAYIQLGAALVLVTLHFSSDYCRLYVASLPIVCLAVEVMIGALGCLVVCIRLACRAEILQVWRQVISTNMVAAIGSGLWLVVAASLYKDLQSETLTSWVTIPMVFALFFQLMSGVLIRDETNSGLPSLACTISLLLSFGFYALHRMTGVPVVSAFFPVPLCLLFLIAFSFRLLTVKFIRPDPEDTFLGTLRDAMSLVGFCLFLLPALELVITCSSSGTGVCGASEVKGLVWGSAEITVPVGVLLLAPCWVSNLGEWAESVAFGFLVI